MILQELFPPSSVNLSSVKPLSWDDTIERFLLPEVAVLLIMDDMDAPWEDAVEILHERTDSHIKQNNNKKNLTWMLFFTLVSDTNTNFQTHK
jgi:hypothetical protein